MARIEYTPKKFQPAALRIIAQAVQICEEYRRQGYDLTLRQLYYQFVARGIIANRQTEYSRLGGIINDARLAGLLDWDFIVDRTRNLRNIAHWERPENVIESAASSWATDRWANQPTRVEVWIEKDALVGVLDAVCPDEDVPYFSCRGYTSQSEVWGAAQRIGGYIRNGQNVTIIHLGDHDPSGIDMTRDIEDRLRLFIGKDNVNYLYERLNKAYTDGFLVPPGFEGDDYKASDEYKKAIAWLDVIENGFGHFSINRIALNMDQVEEYDPPPNPAKLTDSRAQGYIAVHGDESWELDALDPATLAQLIRDAIDEERDADLWEEATDDQEAARTQLEEAARRWSEVSNFLDDNPEGSDDAS